MDILVSVIVITYNSESFVLETLESIRNQTYKNIELIISDDCSADNTIQIVKKWVTQNEKYFANVCIVESEKNTGISPNCNRGLNKAKGKYLKFIAGDDTLISTCIEDNLFYATKHNANFIFSEPEIFTTDREGQFALEKYIEVQKKCRIYFELDSKEQLRKMLIEGNFIFACVNFINREKLIEYGGYDENYPFLEDYPLWIKLLKAGEHFFYLNKKTVNYRIHKDSINLTKKNQFISPRLYKDLKKLYINEIRPCLNFWQAFDRDIHWKRIDIVVNNNNTEKEYETLKFLTLLSPLFIFRKISKFFEGR